MGHDAGILLPYQATWVDDRSPVKVCVKSRRIGITWATAYEAVECASLDQQYGGCDVWYMTYAEEDAKEFIHDVESFARAAGLAVTKATEVVEGTEAAEEYFLANGQASIKITSIAFSSGFRVTVLPAMPRKLRGKDGVFILDEADSFEDLEGAFVAAQAFRMWGGRIVVVSTMGDIEGEFCKLVQEIKKGEGTRGAYSLHVITLVDAANDGLYRRICEVTNEPWSEEGERRWLQEMLATDGAETELMCQPRLPKGYGSVFNPRAWCEFVDEGPSWDPETPKHPKIVKSVRAWDRAATRPHAKNRDPDWTRGVLVQWSSDGRIWISNGVGLRDDPGEVTDLIRRVARQDGKDTVVAIWQDPGAAGKYEAEDMRVKQLRGCRVHVEPAREAKHAYWRPAAIAMKPEGQATRGKFTIVNGPWVDDFCTELARCPNGLHDDWADALALAFMVGEEVSTRFEVSVPARRRRVML